MAVTAKRVTNNITISGSSQSATTVTIIGKIQQIIFESSTNNQFADIYLQNQFSEEIWRQDQLGIDTVSHDHFPSLIPLGPVTINIDNPLNQSGTITVTFIIQERT